PLAFCSRSWNPAACTVPAALAARAADNVVIANDACFMCVSSRGGIKTMALRCTVSLWIGWRRRSVAGGGRRAGRGAVVQRAAGERREACAEDHSGVGQVGI